MWVWRERKVGGEGEGRREGHPLFRRRDGEREEENQRGKAKRRRDEKRQGRKEGGEGQGETTQGEEGDDLGPFRSHGSEGVAMVGTWG